MSRLKRVLLNGPAFGGKTTVADDLKINFGFQFFSTGDEYRAMKPDSEDGQIATACQVNGDLVPDCIHIPIVDKKWPIFREQNALWNLGLDGAIRTIGQVDALLPLINAPDERFDSLVQVVLRVDEEELWRRWNNQAVDPNRGNRLDDKSRETFANRLDKYKRYTLPAVLRAEQLGVETHWILAGSGHSKETVRLDVRNALGLVYQQPA